MPTVVRPGGNRHFGRGDEDGPNPSSSCSLVPVLRGTRTSSSRNSFAQVASMTSTSCLWISGAPIIKAIVNRFRNAAEGILNSKEATATTPRRSRIGEGQAQRHQIPSHAPDWQKRMIMTVEDVLAWFVLVFGRVVEARVALGIRL